VTAGFQPAHCPTSEEFAAWTHTSCCYFKHCFICIWTFCFSLISDSFAEKLTSEMLFLVNLSAMVWSNVSSLSICYINVQSDSNKGASHSELPSWKWTQIGLVHQLFCFSFIFYIFSSLRRRTWPVTQLRRTQSTCVTFNHILWHRCIRAMSACSQLQLRSLLSGLPITYHSVGGRQRRTRHGECDRSCPVQTSCMFYHSSTHTQTATPTGHVVCLLTAPQVVSNCHQLTSS